jgi:tetratricopeptide (TPR) repeat protein
MGVHLDRARVLFQQSRVDLAEKELRQELAVEADSAPAHSLLALCLLDRKEYDSAAEEAKLAIFHSPDMPFAHYVLSQVYLQRNMYEEALESVNEAIRLEPEDADYFHLLGNIRLQQRRWPDALEAAEKGLALDPEHISCTNLRAVALVKLNRKAEAGATIDAALRKDPENADTHANQGWTLLEQNLPQRAMLHFREALRLEPNHEWARMGIVEALKARHFIYGLMLRYFLWIGKLGRSAQWYLMLGGWFGAQALLRAGERNPTIEPYTWPIVVVYAAFVWMTWLADPLFNTLLRLNRFGRLALSADQTRASTLIASCLALTAIMFALSYKFVCCYHWFLFGFLILPIAGTFQCEPGWPRKVMIAVSIFAFLCILSAVGILIAAEMERLEVSEATLKMYRTVFQTSLWVCMLSTFLTNILGSITVRK